MSVRAVWSSVVLSAFALVIPQIAAAADCPLCGYGDCEALDRCNNGRPNKIKIVIKRPLFCGSSICPAPPVGVIATPAVGAMFVVPSANTANGADLRQIVQEELRNARNANAAVPAAGSTQTCTDPCGDINQLKKDVAELKALTNRLAGAVETLSKDYKERH